MMLFACQMKRERRISNPKFLVWWKKEKKVGTEGKKKSLEEGKEKEIREGENEEGRVREQQNNLILFV